MKKRFVLQSQSIYNLSMHSLIAVVDDEEDILELVSINLRKAGFDPKTFADAESFFRFLNNATPDLVILDLMLPDMDGYDICRFLKASERLSRVPIIMLTARTDEMDRVLGLEIGADDYVTKPFSPRELVARVKAVLRRERVKEEAESMEIHGILKLDPDRHKVYVHEKEIELTATEFRILRILISGRGRIFTREQILELLWGNEKTVVDRTVDVHIRHLREKLGIAGGMIKNVRGIGYRLEG